MTKAHSKDPQDIWNLYDYVDPRHLNPVSIAVVDVALKHLSADFSPNLVALSSNDLANIDCVLAAVSIVHALVAPPHVRVERFRDALVDQILEKVDGICSWTSLFLKLGFAPRRRAFKRQRTGFVDPEVCTSSATLLVDTMIFETRLHQRLTSSPAFLEVALQLWTAK